MGVIKNFLYRLEQKLVNTGQKNVWGHEHFFRKRSHLMPKFNSYNLFSNKFDAKYFHVKQFFGKSVFSGGTAKNCLG